MSSDMRSVPDLKIELCQSMHIYMTGVCRDAFTCVGWQVTLCDPIWQVTSHSPEMGTQEEYVGLLASVGLDGLPAHKQSPIQVVTCPSVN